MFRNEIAAGVTDAIDEYPEMLARASEVAGAIEAAAIFDDASGAQIISVNPDEETVVRYDIGKGIFAASGILGAGAALVVGAVAPPAAAAGALAALGALGAMQGVKVKLSPACAHLVLELLRASERRVGRRALRDHFLASHQGPRAEGTADSWMR